jgi:hypothetical protein
VLTGSVSPATADHDDENNKNDAQFQKLFVHGEKISV